MIRGTKSTNEENFSNLKEIEITIDIDSEHYEDEEPLIQISNKNKNSKSPDSTQKDNKIKNSVKKKQEVIDLNNSSTDITNKESEEDEESLEECLAIHLPEKAVYNRKPGCYDDLKSKFKSN